MRIWHWAHCACLAAVLGLALIVDGNGEFLGLGQALSILVASVVFVAAALVAGFLVAKERGWWRLAAVGALVFYALMILPALIP